MRKVIWVLIITMNVVCFFGVVADKNLAAAGPYRSNASTQRRTAEVTLVSRAALGGAPGTYVGFLAASHKTSSQKDYLRRAIKWTLVENVVLYALALSWARNREAIRRNRRETSMFVSSERMRRRA